MPGELVVPTTMVKAGAVDHLRGRIPGFAAGGVVGSYTGPPDKAMGAWAVGMWQQTIHAIQAATAAATAAGIRAAQAAAAAGAGSFGGKVLGSTVASWIAQALKIAGAPASWLGALEVLVGKESGGNPRAYNPISVGGQHATGLFQTLPSTFAAYSLGGSIYNPVADAIAGIRYLRSRYGSPYNIPGLLGGTYNGYDSGGWLPPGMSMAYNGTGRPERVSPAGGNGSLESKLDTLIQQNRTLIQQGMTNPSEVAAGLGKVFNQTARAGARAAYYSTRPGI
jgi:SLT domain-containing protein